MARCALGTVALTVGRASPAAPPEGEAVVRETFAFIDRCRKDDGGYAPSPDPSYKGNSDTRLSDLAGVTYAAVLAKTFGRELPHAKESADYIHACQQPDGRFVHRSGEHDPKAELGILYDTTQAVVALRALGQSPRNDPTPVVARFLERSAFRDLPWYTTSFFPLFYAALGKPFPDEFREALARHMESHQAEDGYLGDHVAATFHMAHFYRMIGRPTPKADRMVARVLKDQTSEGGWDIKHPDWDVHAAFDAAFILRQLGGDAHEVREALGKAADWVLRCRNADGGFGHFPGRHSDMDAVYFQLGTLVQAGRAPGVRRDIPDAQTLGWGHAMEPGKNYEPTPVGR
jgi:geranylgeranyl transferase type-2 subunit beta